MRRTRSIDLAQPQELTLADEGPSVTLDRFGRIVIPKAMRDRLGLVPGDELTIEAGYDGLYLRLRQPEPDLVREGSVLVYCGELTEDVADFVSRQREERLRKQTGLGTG